MSASTPDHVLGSLLAVIGHGEDSRELQELLQVLGPSTLNDAGVERKQYPDITYLNLYKVGISLQLETDAQPARVVTAIDIYNHHPNILGDEAKATKRPKTTYKPFPALPLPIAIAPRGEDQTLAVLVLHLETSGTEFVKAWGEPKRKGGGTGPIGRGPAAWMEWSLCVPPDPAKTSRSPTPLNVNVMVELGGEGSRGPRVWESDSAGASPWKVLTFSAPASESH